MNNLRDDDGHALEEEAEARAAGLQYVNVPMSNFNRPADKTVEKVLAIINERENQPVFVHCKRGSDRTGRSLPFTAWSMMAGPANRLKQRPNVMVSAFGS
jgi:protein tyrosine/serine phosphatase